MHFLPPLLISRVSLQKLTWFSTKNKYPLRDLNSSHTVGIYHLAGLLHTSQVFQIYSQSSVFGSYWAIFAQDSGDAADSGNDRPCTAFATTVRVFSWVPPANDLSFCFVFSE